MVGGERPDLPEISGQTDPVGAKTPFSFDILCSASGHNT